MSRFYNLDQAPFNSRELSKAIVAAIAGQSNGAFFDAQDMSTMFQDAAGTVPVTAMEQPVGKWLDKSGKGNHATQSVTASRPVVSARYNLLTKTEDLTDTQWAKEQTTVLNTNSFREDSSVHFHRIRRSDFTVRPSEQYIISWFFKPVGRQYYVFRGNEGTDSVLTNAAVDVVNKLVVYSDPSKTLDCIFNEDGTVVVNISFTTTASKTNIQTSLHTAIAAQSDNNLPTLFQGVTTAGADNVKISVISGSKKQNYQRVNTATDYDTVGFKKYLKFDGIDDYLNLPYLGLYLNGSASIVAARDALSQATDTYVLSERSASNVNPKYFPSRQLANAGNMDAYIVNDEAVVVVDTVGSVYGGSSNAVIRSVVDSGNNIKLFKNGALAANDNYARSGILTLTNTTIGASVSTAISNYANMKLYGLVITKSALSDSERRRVERLLAYNSGAQI